MISTFTSHMDLFCNLRIIRLLLLLTRSKNMFSSGIISLWRQWGQGSTGCCWWSYNNPGNPVPTYHSLLAAGDKSWTLPSHQVSTLTQNSDLPISLSKAKLFLCDNWQGDNTVLTSLMASPSMNNEHSSSPGKCLKKINSVFFSILLWQLNVLRAQANMVTWDFKNFQEQQQLEKSNSDRPETSNSPGLDVSSSSWGASASVQATMLNWRKLYKGGVIKIGIFNCEPHHHTLPAP